MGRIEPQEYAVSITIARPIYDALPRRYIFVKRDGKIHHVRRYKHPVKCGLNELEVFLYRVN